MHMFMHAKAGWCAYIDVHCFSPCVIVLLLALFNSYAAICRRPCRTKKSKDEEWSKPELRYITYAVGDEI